MPPAQAISAIVDDAASWDRFVVQDLLTLDGLGAALIPRLEHPDGPLYGEALAYLDCRLYEILPGGDHDIFIGEIVAGEAQEEGQPLLYYSGRYRRLAEAP